MADDGGLFEESAAFRVGKAQAIQDLLPYAKPGSIEAAVCGLRADGTRYDFKLGSASEVAINIPLEECAVFHSHSDDSPHSGKDFAVILNNRQVRDTFVVTAKSLYQLHKPFRGFVVPGSALSEDELEERLYQHTFDATTTRILEGLDVDSERAEQELGEEGAKRLTEQFGLKFHAEAHSP